jgi:hypothetical protein
MPRSGEGNLAHKKLVELAVERLQSQGYKTATSVKLPGRFRCDVLAEKDSEKVVVECFLRPDANLIEEKRKMLEGYAKFVVAIPRGYRRYESKDIEVWVFDISA